MVDPVSATYAGLTAAQWVAAAITVGSTAYSIAQAKKMRSSAKKAAEARKGFEVPVEGIAQNVPIVYGRALIGGARVYHQTKGNFNFVNSGSDKVFLAGLTSDEIQPFEFILPPRNNPEDYLPGGPSYSEKMTLIEVNYEIN
jgi:hypothetical protein